MPLTGPERELDTLRRNLALKEIPSLNGLRALASMTVVMFHVVSQRFPGRQAVTLFFVLSGFLITLRLVAEFETRQTIDIVGFYVRRARRLLPAYYVWLFLVVLLLTGRATPEIGAAALYVSDYYAAWIREGLIAHTWSLSVEEHFYLLWPAVLPGLTRFRSRFRLNAIVAVVIAIQAVRFVLGARYPRYFNYAFEVNLDALLLGCGLALWLKERATIPRLLVSRWAWMIPVLTFSVIGFLPAYWMWTTASTLAAWSSAALIARTIYEPPAILNNRIASALGAWSYSLYLYHVLVRWIYMRLVPGATGEGYVVYGWMNRSAVIALSLAAAWASYTFVERPYRRRRSENPLMAVHEAQDEVHQSEETDRNTAHAVQ